MIYRICLKESVKTSEIKEIQSPFRTLILDHSHDYYD